MLLCFCHTLADENQAKGKLNIDNETEMKMTRLFDELKEDQTRKALREHSLVPRQR